MIDQTDDVDWTVEGQELTVQADGTIEGVSYSVVDMKTAVERLEAGTVSLPTKDPGAMSTAALERLVFHRKSIERWFNLMYEELLGRANDGEQLTLWKLVPGRPSNREWNNNEEDIASDLDFLGVPEDKMHVKKLGSPAHMEEVLRKTYGLTKKNAALLIADLTTRADGKPTLALVSDSREALPDLADDTFEPVSDDL